MNHQGRGRAWGLVVLLAVGLALLSLALDHWVGAWVSIGDDLWLVTRLAASEVVGSGVVWAGLLVLAGRLVGRPAAAALAGFLAGELTLATYAAVGLLLGAHGWELVSADVRWFALVLVAGPALGVVGSLSRRSDVVGLLARLLVPSAAVLEPLLRGMFVAQGPPGSPLDTAAPVAGAALVLAGLVSAVALVLRARRAHRET